MNFVVPPSYSSLLFFSLSRVVFKLNLRYSRHLRLLVITAALCLLVWLLPLPSRPPCPYPPSSRLLPQLPWSGWLAPLLKGAGVWVYEGSLWGTIQPYHHREAILWKAEGCFWTSRYMEITDQSSDWQATDCMCLSGSRLMGADGFCSRWRPAGCMRADCMVSNKANAVLQYCALFLYLLYENVISHLSKMFLSCLCGRVHEQRQFNLSAEIKETKCQIYEAKHFHFKLFFL